MRRLTRAFGGARATRDVDGLLRSALLATLDRDIDRAEALLSRAVRSDSGDVDAFMALARLFRMRGEIGRAIRIHQNLLLRTDLPPERRVRVVADLAADFQQGGFIQRAIASYEETLGRDPKHVPAMQALVRLYTEARDFERAIAMARRLGRARHERSHIAEAGLYVDMADAARAEGRNADARKAAKRALRRDRDLVRGWILLGELEAERGHARAALSAWARVPKIDRRSGPLVYPQLEATHAALGHPRDFEKFLRELLAEQSDDGGARLALASALSARGEADGALAELRIVLEKNGDDLSALAAIGRTLLTEGRDAEASRLLADLLDALERRGLLHATEKLE